MAIQTNNQVNVGTIITVQNQKTKEQIQKENYEKLEKPKEIFKRLGYVYPTPKKTYTLNNGLKVKNRRQFIKRTYKCERILAFDTETYQGKCKLIACSQGKSILNPNFYQCIRFLFSLANKPNIYRFFYNLDFDFTSILKLWKSRSKPLQKRILQKIKWLKQGIEVKYNKYLIKWIKGRMLCIKHITRRKSVVFTDIFNFFSLGLNKSSELYLKDFKIDDIDGNLLNTSLDYWKEREKDIIKYCIQDCKLTKRLGKLLIDTIIKNDLPLPKYIVSSASLSKQFFRLNCFIPNISHVPKKVLQIAYDTYFGGRFEIFKKGFFDNLHLYDINSQYPTFIKNLPNMRDGVWKKTNIIPKCQCLGYFKVKINIPKDYRIPTLPLFHKGINKFPVGTFERWFTWFDLDLVRDYIVEVYKGFIFIPTCKNYKPFEKEIDNLFIKKQKLKNKSKLDYTIVKLCMNALYGCFIETHKNYNKDGTSELNSGILFNSVYASQITAFGRWSVIKDIPKDKYKHIIAIHTDSIISDIVLDKFLTLDLKLGNWNKESEGKGIVLNTGMYQIGYLVKTRGIPKKFIKNWLRFCLKNHTCKKKTIHIKHMRKLAEGLVRDKSLVNVNTIVNDIRSVNCNSDSKRDWINDFRSFKDVININVDSFGYYHYSNDKSLHPNPLSIAYRFENKTK